jgi:hypothetical protein
MCVGYKHMVKCVLAYEDISLRVVKCIILILVELVIPVGRAHKCVVKPSWLINEYPCSCGQISF